MSRIVPFSKCIARPKEENTIFSLKEHLEGVRNIACSLFPNGMQCEHQVLIELAALSHDITKANAEWQEYIHGNKSTGPNHSGSGAIFFSYLSYYFLVKEGRWHLYENQLLWLLITRDIADHHGILRGYAKNLDIEKGDFEQIDLEGIQNWLYSLFPILKKYQIPINEESLDEWQFDIFPELTEDVIDVIYEKKREDMPATKEMMEILQQWRTLTAVLIASDRFDISYVKNPRFSPKDWEKMDQHINKFCKQGESHPLAKIRSNAQESILQQWEKNRKSTFYVLEMPTGYGKTITSLKLASEIAKKEGFSKIIYVAPYLSILEQNAESIQKAISHTPLQHHSMAIINNNLLDENKETDQHADLVSQSWANQVICTSFVQWMKAIFPRRAQETLRRIHLKDSIIIIDEPQIMDAGVWNLFLSGLESLSQIYHLKVIFCSATMPPFQYGLNEFPTRLHISAKKANDRYLIKVSNEQFTAKKCADKLSNINEPSAAAIVNTIQDSIDVFDALSNEKDINAFLVHGLMIPLHKSIQLQKIHEKMRSNEVGTNSKRIRVVSTQILEAGVDLSFHYMFRALPILPSLIQSAGRVNRHGEKKIGIIETAKFIREENDTRFIYGNNLCRISDKLLFSKNIWYESEMEALVKNFYEWMFKENRYESVLQDIEAAYVGNWEKLSQHDVFRNDNFHRLPIFIPYPIQEESKLIPENISILMKKFNVSTSQEIYELFLDSDKRKKWSFNENKQFQILFHQFVVNVPADKALKLISKEEFLQRRIPMLEDNSYSLERGLAISMQDDFLI